MYFFFLLLIAAGCVLAFHNWRWGIVAAIVVGLTQDAVRKITPGVPVLLTVASLPIWLISAAVAIYPARARVRAFLRSMPRLARWLTVFGIYLALPAALSATHGVGTWQITLLGAVTYTSMFLMLLAGWNYPDRRHAIVPLLAFYALSASVLLIGGPLDVMGWGEQWRAIGTLAFEHVWVTHRTGEAVYMYSGFFRGPDVMGWHASLVGMIATILALRSRSLAARVFWIAIGLWGGGSLWLCGRRKMLSMIPIFLGSILLLHFRFRGARRFVPLAGTVLMILGLAWQTVGSLQADHSVRRYYLTTLDEWDEQLLRHGLWSVIETVKQSGFFGYGLGMSQQGIHHLHAETPLLWQESGPSKLFAEMGVPGAFLFIIMGWVLLRTAYEVVRRSSRDASFLIYAGMFSILIANLASAFVSAQIYGDVMVVLLLAFITGLLLSGGRPTPPGKEASCAS